MDSPTRKHADFLLDGIIKEVLEKDPFSYEVKRADKDVSPGSINSAVINDILNADLAIADLSERNPNAFYELGIRHACDKPVIHMIQSGEQIPFDNFDQRCISFSTETWSGILSAREDLRGCVEYISSSEYKSSNPVTIAKALQSIANSGGDAGLALNSLMEEVNSLRKENRNLYAKLNNVNVNHKEFSDDARKALYDALSNFAASGDETGPSQNSWKRSWNKVA